MKKCLRFTKGLITKMCSLFPYFSYPNLKCVRCFIYLSFLCPHFIFFASQKSWKRESEARNYIVIARTTLSEHVGVHVYFHNLRL
jgi:hypothetical protein